MADDWRKGGKFLFEETKPEDIFTYEDFDEEALMLADTAAKFALKEVLPKHEQLEASETKIETIDTLIFSAPIGKPAGPVETEFGFSIVMVEERKEAGSVSFEDAQETLHREVLFAKRKRLYEQFMVQLEAKYHVERMP